MNQLNEGKEWDWMGWDGERDRKERERLFLEGRDAFNDFEMRWDRFNICFFLLMRGMCIF